MKIKILRQQGKHVPGDIVEVVRIVPHGGNYDDARQYVLLDGTHVPKSAAAVVDTPVIRRADDEAVTRSIEELGESYAQLAERWALHGADRAPALEAAKAALTDAAWVVFCLAPEFGLAADRALLREVVKAFDDTIEGDIASELVERIRAHLGRERSW